MIRSVIGTIIEDEKNDEVTRMNCLACQKKIFCPKHSGEKKLSHLMPEEWKGEKLKAIMRFYHTGVSDQYIEAHGTKEERAARDKKLKEVEEEMEKIANKYTEKLTEE